MTDLRLDFQIKMDGADAVSRQLRQMSSELNQMPKSAREGLEGLNQNISNIVSSLGKLSSATSGLSGIDKNIERAFGSAQSGLIRNFKKEIEDLEKEMSRLSDRTERLNRMGARARAGGNEGRATNLEAAAVESGMQYVAARDLLEGSRREYDRVTGNGPGRVSSFLNQEVSISQTVQSVLRGLGLGNLSGGVGALGFAGYATLAGANYLATGGARSAIAERRYSESAADEAIYGGDPTRALIRRRGLGPEGEVLNGSSFSPGNLARGFFGLLSGVSSGLSGRGFNAGIYNYMQGLSDLSKEQFADLSRISAFRQNIGSQLGGVESVLGQTGTYGALEEMARLGVDLGSAAPALNALIGYGATPGRSDARFAIAGERFGVSGSLSARIAQAEAFRRRTGGDAGVNTSLDQALQLFSQAGLGGRGAFPARGAFADLVAENAGFYGATGAEGISGFGGGLAASVAAAGGTGLSPADAVRIGGSQFGVERGAMNTAFDPRRTLAIGTLVSQGLTAAEAEVFVRLGLENPNTQNQINELIRRRTGRRANIGQSLASGRRQLDQSIQGAFKRGGMIGNDLDEILGGAGTGAAILTTGEGTAAGARARFAAGEAFLSGEGGKMPMPEEAARTTSQVQREERAAVDRGMATALKAVGDTISEAIRGNAVDINENVSKIVNILQGDRDKPPAAPMVVTPGAPNRGSNR